MESGRVQNREKKLQTKQGQQTGFGHEKREKGEEQGMKRKTGPRVDKRERLREHSLHSRVIRRNEWLVKEAQELEKFRERVG